MYGHSARKAIIAILKDTPELKIGDPPKSVLKPAAFTKLADRMLIELWMRGFAVAARQPKSQPPVRASRSPQEHAEWRRAKLKPSKQAEI
jgi:hypothetical protein